MMPAAVDASAASTQCSFAASLFDNECNTLTCAAGEDLRASASDDSSSTAHDTSNIELGFIVAFANFRMQISAY